MYIPDLTERFPEGFGGVDMTDRYFPRERGYDYFDYLADHYYSDDDYDLYEDDDCCLD